jgi:hypothetical protein
MRALKSIAVALVLGSTFCPPLAGQKISLCMHVQFCLFNQRAEASDAAGIHKYSEDVIGMLLFDPMAKDSVRQLTGDLADRLADAEQAARAGRRRLVPEAAVVQAFNDLMQKIGAQPTIRANEASMRSFREHAVAIKAFPALFSAGRNGTNCNPGEAVFLLYLLMSNNGVLYERSLDTAQEMMQSYNQLSRGGGMVGRMVSVPEVPDAQRLLTLYVLNHNRQTTALLFNNLTGTLGF